MHTLDDYVSAAHDEDLVARLLANVHVDDNGCWMWMGSRDEHGYGRVRRLGRVLKAHRISYVAHRGSFDAELVIDHLCRVPSCINPDHLEPVTNAENVMRGESFGPKNAAATHCAHGHEFTIENTMRTGYRKQRVCRTCRCEAWAARSEETNRKRREKNLAHV